MNSNVVVCSKFSQAANKTTHREGNEITDEGARFLSEALALNTTITTLYLDCHQHRIMKQKHGTMNQRHHKQIFNSQQDWRQWSSCSGKNVAFEHCSHDTQPGWCIPSRHRYESWRKTSTFLQMSTGNEIGSRGVCALAQALEVNTTLTSLGLSGLLSNKNPIKHFCSDRSTTN